jgi:arsenate reductase-like glutaredoxin family protein
VREFLAREDVKHDYVDVRKGPIPPKQAVAIVRKHKRAIAKVAGKIHEIDPKTATDKEIEKLFLGREGTMRAPCVSDGKTILGGFDEETLASMLG